VSDAQVAEVKATIDRKTIRARLGCWNPAGQPRAVLSAGQAIVPLQSLDPIYVNFGVPQQDAGQIKLGSTIRITSQDAKERTYNGKVTAFDSVVMNQPATFKCRRPYPIQGKAARRNVCASGYSTGADRQVISVQQLRLTMRLR